MARDIKYSPVSIVIVNYNGAGFVEACLDSVLRTDYPDFDLILVDNASTDTGPQEIERRFGREARLKVVRNETNLGAVGGRNIGISLAQGKYVAFLDNDTETEAGWLKALVEVLESEPRIGAAQSKILLADRKTIDTCGHFISLSGFPYEIGVNEIDRGQYNKTFDILGARSAAMIVRKEILDQIGNFDASYFIYSEETDLCWRIWLNNYRVVFVPESVVYHKRGGSLNPRSRYRTFYEGAKNSTKTLVNNLGFLRLALILPVHLFGWAMITVLLSLKGRFKDAGSVLKGLGWDLTHLGILFKDRKRIQGQRKIPDRKIFPVITGNLGFRALLNKGLGWVTRI